MPRRPIVGGNWKCNPESPAALPELIANINACNTAGCDVYVCPSNLHVGMVYDKFTNGAMVAPQNCNFKGCGAYTGEMAAEQMVAMGIKWCMIGHSERRGEFGLPTPSESNELMKTKMEYLLSKGLNVIYAIGEPLPVRQGGIDAVLAYCVKQLEPLKHLLDPSKVVIAYEPVWSIGTGVTASPAEAQETHKAIRDWIATNCSPAVADAIRIQYGGSANAKNAPELAKCPDVDGFLVGGASLKPEFKEIVAAITPALAPPVLEGSVEKFNPPMVDGRKILLNGEVLPFDGQAAEVFAPIFKPNTEEKVVIGYQARMTEEQSLAALDAAVKSWKMGRGEWAQAPPAVRIAKVEQLVAELKPKRDDIINVLMWEIAKTKADATKEFDRTMDFIRDTIKTYKAMLTTDNAFIQDGGVLAQIKRTPIGVMLNLGPFNYPFNETYCTLIPAILMGNSVVMKLPNVGSLAHVCTMEAYAKVFPPGVVNFISGAGRTTMPPLMKSGMIDLLAFIGGSRAADTLVKQHPTPHKLKQCLSLDAKNLCVVMDDVDVAAAVKECITGTLSYNGQRCTALKLLFVHASIVDEFVQLMVKTVDSMKLGLPWEKDAKLTPLPEPDKPKYLKDLIDDAVAKGAKIANGLGGQMAGPNVRPTILYPCSKEMRVWQEEQFGPVIPIAPFTSFEQCYQYLAESPFGQQAAVFAKDVTKCVPLLDTLALSVGRVNVNAQCQRGPDSFPFTGRKSSALGTLSVTEALKTVSIESVIATKDDAACAKDMLALAESDANCVTATL